MLAIDTNLIVRYLTGDHPKQSPRARELIDGEAVFAASTVILQVEWVLRSRLWIPPGRCGSGAAGFCGPAHCNS